mgnify:CR=1 FL=1
MRAGAGFVWLLGRSRTSALCLLVVLLGCRSEPAADDDARSAPKAVIGAAATGSVIDPAAVFPGSWACPDSSAVWQLGAAGGAMSVAGVDVRDGEAFEVGEVTWDGGSVLRFSARMPSTDWTVVSTLRVLDRNTLKAERDGAAPWSCVLSRTADPAQ